MFTLNPFPPWKYKIGLECGVGRQGFWVLSILSSMVTSEFLHPFTQTLSHVENEVRKSPHENFTSSVLLLPTLRFRNVTFEDAQVYSSNAQHREMGTA